MTTNAVDVTAGTGTHVATNTITEDAETKHLQRVVLNDSTGAGGTKSIDDVVSSLTTMAGGKALSDINTSIGASRSVKNAYAGYTDLTFTSLASLASDASLLAGASSAVVSNTSNLYGDILVTAQIKVNTGAAPTANTSIEVWAYAPLDSTPTYPDTILGTDATKTLTNLGTKTGSLALLATFLVAATTSVVYQMQPVSLAAAFGGTLPNAFGLFVVHNTGQTLAASGSKASYNGITQSIA